MPVLYLLASAFPTLSRKRTKTVETSSPLAILPKWALVILAFLCLGLTAIVAGLTIGLMCLDVTGLTITSHSPDPAEREAARKIIPIRRNSNLLLVTLLLGTCIATELLPLVLEALFPGGLLSLLIAIFSIMLFGEIIPQAVCSRNPLLIGAFFVPFVRVLEFVLYPVAFPIAWILDKMLGKEKDTIYDRHQLKFLLAAHHDEEHGTLTKDETSILRGALDLSVTPATKVMTKADDVFMLDLDTKLDESTLAMILRKGHSRVPLFDKHRGNIKALLLTKQLLLVSPEDNIPARAMVSQKKKSGKARVAHGLIVCSKDAMLDDLLNIFQEGRSHMAIVYDDAFKPAEQRKFLGVVTLEDIIEEILQEEIIDETDVYQDNRSKLPVFIRGRDGRLMRTTARTVNSELMLPGTRTIIVNQIDVAKLKMPKWHTQQPPVNTLARLKVSSGKLGLNDSEDLEPVETFRSPKADAGAARRLMSTPSRVEMSF